MVLDNVVIAEIGETEKARPKTRDKFRSIEEYYADTIQATYSDSSFDVNAVEGLGIMRPSVQTPFNYPSMLAQILGLEDIEWLVTTDHGGANAVAMLIQGALAIESGIIDSFLCLGADISVEPRDSSSPFSSDPRGYVKNYKDPMGTQGPNSRMAHVQRRHMSEYGTTIDQLSELPVAQRKHAQLNPLAYFDEGLTRDDYVNSDLIADPIRLYDCVIPVNGGFGILLLSREKAAGHVDVPVEISGFGVSTNHDVDVHPDPTTTGIKNAANRAFSMATLDRDDMDFVQPYDDYPIITLMQLEDIGFCEKGDGGKFIAETDVTYEGDLPINTSGGQLSGGQAGLAGGFIQLVEGIRQLQGNAGERQIPGADAGIITGVGGVSYGKNLRNNEIVILQRGDQDA